MYQAKRLPTHKGPAAWAEILPRRAKTAPLSLHRNADFVIIGAGFAGLTAARRLLQLQPTAQIVVLEAGEIGKAASGRNSGFMIDLPHELTSNDYAGTQKSSDREIIELNRQAIAFGKNAVEELDIDKNYFDPIGKVNGASTDKGHTANLSYADHLKSLNENYDLLDRKQMKELTGSDYYTSGLFTPGTVMLQPAGYVHGLAGGLASSASLHENSPVLEIMKQGSDWLVKTPKGSVSTGNVILANNGHLESFGFKRHRLMHIFLFAAMTRELDADDMAKLGGQSRWGVTPSDPMGTTIRRIDSGQGGNRIAIRTCAEFQPNMTASDWRMNHAKRIMRRKFDDRFPMSAGLEMEYNWAGHLCLSRNSVSVTGKLDDGIYAACCQNGLGTTRGTLTGIAAAEMAAGTESRISKFFSKEAKPSKLPPPPFSTIGANAYLMWKEHKAKLE